ncbi:MAG: hypothetical protein GQ574_05580 [Crocinitomix sp.]|nr:hypothetical protein [Crocinitomix sp.]
MRNCFLLFIVCFLSSCEEKPGNDLGTMDFTVSSDGIAEDIPSNPTANEEPLSEYEFPFLDKLIDDTLKVELKDGMFCLNHDLDSMTELSSLYSLQLIDVNDSIIIIHFPPMLGAIQIERLEEGKYVFIASADFPVNGDWEIKFVKHDILKYVFEIHEDHYLVYRDKSVRLDLPFSKEKIEALKKEIMESKECLSEDWEIATDCFPKIEQYEYQLFAAIIAGESIYEDDYLDLRNTISMVNAGQFSEYLEGNYYLLRLYGITNDKAYDYSVLRMRYQMGKVPHCFYSK